MQAASSEARADAPGKVSAARACELGRILKGVDTYLVYGLSAASPTSSHKSLIFG
jgi:hypothetical protein